MDPIAKHRWIMRAKRYLTLGNVALIILLVVEIFWMWSLWKIGIVVLDILKWGGEI